MYTAEKNVTVARMRGQNTKKNVPPSVKSTLALGIKPSRPSLFKAIERALWSTWFRSSIPVKIRLPFLFVNPSLPSSLVFVSVLPSPYGLLSFSSNNDAGVIPRRFSSFINKVSGGSSPEGSPSLSVLWQFTDNLPRPRLQRVDWFHLTDNLAGTVEKHNWLKL